MKYEDEDNLRDYVLNAEKVREMVHSKGWTDVVYPALKNRLDSLLEQLLTTTEHGQIQSIQNGAMAIKNLIAFIEGTLTDGELARQEIRDRAGTTEHP